VPLRSTLLRENEKPPLQWIACAPLYVDSSISRAFSANSFSGPGVRVMTERRWLSK
jgi:hypothetical protein